MTAADKMNAHLSKGGVIVVSTYTKATQYDKRHAGRFFMRKDGIYEMRGKKAVCLNGCQIRFYVYRKKHDP